MFECLRYFGRVMSQKCQHLSPKAAVQKAHACIALQPGPVQRPVRTSQEWRPEPLLCKRFNVPDPFKGRQAPSKSATQFKSDLLALPDTAAAAAAGFLPGPPPLTASAQLPGPPVPAPAVEAATAMDSKAMADSFLEALQNGTSQPAEQDASAAGDCRRPLHRLPMPRVPQALSFRCSLHAAAQHNPVKSSLAAGPF